MVTREHDVTGDGLKKLVETIGKAKEVWLCIGRDGRNMLCYPLTREGRDILVNDLQFGHIECVTRYSLYESGRIYVKL